MRIENIREGFSVIINETVCHVECVSLRPPLTAMFNNSLQAEISNSIYSGVYLKVRQVYLETIYCDHDVVAIIPIGFMEVGRRAVQFYSEGIVINCCFSFECARSD